MKTKTKIILGVIAFVLIATGAVLYYLYSQDVFFDKSPIYGTFEYKNEDGTVAKIVLTETTVYCENIDYESIMMNAAYYTVLDDLEEENISIIELETEEIVERENKYMDQWDFKSAFDGKTMKFDDTYYYEDDAGHLYIYEVYYPGTGSYGLDLYVELESKTLGVGDMNFKYVGE